MEDLASFIATRRPGAVLSGHLGAGGITPLPAGRNRRQRIGRAGLMNELNEVTDASGEALP